jgi:hypothetical protein
MSTPFKPYWLEQGAAVPVDIETTATLLRRVRDDTALLRKLVEALELLKRSPNIGVWCDTADSAIAAGKQRLEGKVVEKGAEDMSGDHNMNQKPLLAVDWQAEASDARMDAIMLLEHLKVAIEVLERLALDYVMQPPLLQSNIQRLKQTARDYDHKLRVQV